MVHTPSSPFLLSININRRITNMTVLKVIEGELQAVVNRFNKYAADKLVTDDETISVQLYPPAEAGSYKYLMIIILMKNDSLWNVPELPVQ